MGATKLVVVDVQPAYSVHFMDRFAEFVSSYQEILILYNGPELGFPNNAKIAKWYRKNGVSREVIARMSWFEKNYGFFRDLMGDWDREDIVRLTRYMLRNKIWDWRMLSEPVANRIGEVLGKDMSIRYRENHFFGIPQVAFGLRKWNNCDVIGGSCEECLEEILILMEALQMKYKVNYEFVY